MVWKIYQIDKTPDQGTNQAMRLFLALLKAAYHNMLPVMDSYVLDANFICSILWGPAFLLVNCYEISKGNGSGNRPRVFKFRILLWSICSPLLLLAE